MEKDNGIVTIIAVAIVISITIALLKTFWWLLLGIAVGIFIYYILNKKQLLAKQSSSQNTFSQTCPVCGANTTVNENTSLVKCEYCGSTFPLSEEIANRFKESRSKKYDRRKILLITAGICLVLGILGLYLKLSETKKTEVNTIQGTDQEDPENEQVTTDYNANGDAINIDQDDKESEQALNDTIENTENELSSTETNDTSISPVDKEYSYDALQSLFLQIGKDTTEDELVKMIQDNMLEYTVGEAVSVSNDEIIDYKIAYSHEVALPLRGEEGDYLVVTFSKDTRKVLKTSYSNLNAFDEAYLNDNDDSVYEGTNYMDPIEVEGSDSPQQFVGIKRTPIKKGQFLNNEVYYDSLEDMLHAIMKYADKYGDK